MNTKHYVSLEVAKMLKEKGYNERSLYYTNNIAIPTLLEAMDWLEERDVRIEIRTNMVYGKECKFTYYFAIYQGYDFCPIFESDNYYEIMYHDRYECMNAAIKKGVELL